MKTLFLLLSFFIMGSLFSQNENKIIGVWNLSQYVGSGLDDHFHFFSGGKFMFHSSEMNCKNRALGYEGKWKLNGDTLTLGITTENILTGGTMELSTGSCGSDSEIVGGKETDFSHEEYIVKYAVKISELEKDSINRTIIDIGPIRYWLISNDPKTYH